ncbi:hypothetical protein D3C72_244960 [compost metagenome]
MEPTSYPFRITVLPGVVADIRLHQEVFGQFIQKISSVKVEQDGTIIIDAWTSYPEGAGGNEIPLEVQEG